MVNNVMTHDELQLAYDALKRVHDSANTALVILENQNKSLTLQNQLLVEEKSQWMVDKSVQNSVIHGELERRNQEFADIQQEVQRLREIIKNGNLGKLVN